MIQQHLTDHIQRENLLNYLNTFHICFCHVDFFPFSFPAGCFIKNNMDYQKWLSRGKKLIKTKVHFPAQITARIVKYILLKKRPIFPTW